MLRLKKLTFKLVKPKKYGCLKYLLPVLLRKLGVAKWLGLENQSIRMLEVQLEEMDISVTIIMSW